MWETSICRSLKPEILRKSSRNHLKTDLFPSLNAPLNFSRSILRSTFQKTHNQLLVTPQKHLIDGIAFPYGANTKEKPNQRVSKIRVPLIYRNIHNDCHRLKVLHSVQHKSRWSTSQKPTRRNIRLRQILFSATFPRCRMSEESDYYKFHQVYCD